MSLRITLISRTGRHSVNCNGCLQLWVESGQNCRYALIARQNRLYVRVQRCQVQHLYHQGTRTSSVYDVERHT